VLSTTKALCAIILLKVTGIELPLNSDLRALNCHWIVLMRLGRSMAGQESSGNRWRAGGRDACATEWAGSGESEGGWVARERRSVLRGPER
jgi:hypothetical protein